MIKAGILFMALLMWGLGGADSPEVLPQGNAQRFDIAEYREIIDASQQGSSFGSVETEQEAIAVAEKVLAEKYAFPSDDKEPHEALLDEQNQVWLVQGAVWIEGCWGYRGVAHVLIQKDTGQILAVWYTI